MARVETQQGTQPAGNGAEDEHLDEWFARRLQSQGIPSRLGRPSLARLAAVAALVLSLGGLMWALSSVGPASTASTPASHPSTGGGHSTSTGGGGTTSFTGGKVSWRTVTVDVLNGYGGAGAAGSAAATLRAQGWTVGTTGNATGITQTEVVYLSGHKKEAIAVARRLGLGAPIKISDATGVVPSSTSGVAIVLGPNGLPAR